MSGRTRLIRTYCLLCMARVCAVSFVFCVCLFVVHTHVIIAHIMNTSLYVDRVWCNPHTVVYVYTLCIKISKHHTIRLSHQ